MPHPQPLLPPDRLQRLRWEDPYLVIPHGPLDAGPAEPHLLWLYTAEIDPTVIGRSPDGSPILNSHKRKPTALAGWALHLPYEKNPIPMNRSGSRASWRVEAAAVRQVRSLATLLTLNRIKPQTKIRVRLDWEVVDRRRRDEDNLGKCLKALTDGVRRAGVVMDDTAEFVKREFPEIHFAPRSPTRPISFMRFYIWPELD